MPASNAAATMVPILMFLSFAPQAQNREKNRNEPRYNPRSPSMAQIDLSETTLLLRAWAQGDPTALERLTPIVYGELRRIAAQFMRNERPGRTLQTTAVVHEAY